MFLLIFTSNDAFLGPGDALKEKTAANTATKELSNKTHYPPHTMTKMAVTNAHANEVGISVP